MNSSKQNSIPVMPTTPVEDYKIRSLKVIELNLSFFFVLVLATTVSLVFIFRSFLVLLPGLIVEILIGLRIKASRSERERLHSGFYRRPISLVCPRCNSKVSIDRGFIGNLVRNCSGIPQFPCPYCRFIIPINNLKQYLEHKI